MNPMVQMIQDAQTRMAAGASMPEAWNGAGLYRHLLGSGAVSPQFLANKNRMLWVMQNPDIVQKWVMSQNLKTEAERYAEQDQQRAF